VLTKEEAEAWCRTHQISLNDRGLPERSDLDVKFQIPSDAQQRIALVRRTMQAFKGDPVLLVWFDDWGVWSSGQEMHVFDRFRISYGEARPLIETPAHLFDQTEFKDAMSFVTVAVLFLWDCYVVVPNRIKLLAFSHDEYGLAKGIEIEGLDGPPSGRRPPLQ